MVLIKCKSKFIYLIISLRITFTLSRDKYFFLLDQIPKISDYIFLFHFYGMTPSVYGGTLPVNFISSTIPAQIFQKVFIFLILFL